MSHQHRQIVWQVPMKVPRPFFLEDIPLPSFTQRPPHLFQTNITLFTFQVAVFYILCSFCQWLVPEIHGHTMCFSTGPEVLRSSGNYTKDGVPLTPGQDEAPLPRSSVSYLPAESSSSWNLHPLLPPEHPQPPSSFNSVTLIIPTAGAADNAPQGPPAPLQEPGTQPQPSILGKHGEVFEVFREGCRGDKYRPAGTKPQALIS